MRGLIIFLLTVITGLASGLSAKAQLRPMVYADIIVDRSAEQAFHDWTTAETVEAFFAAKAFIDPQPGGDYALWFAVDATEGSRGSDTGKVLALQSGEMLSVTWAMPPYMPEIRPHLTVIQILFEPVHGSATGTDQTKIRLFHTGFGTGEAWDKGHDYFESTWPAVLDGYKIWADNQ